MDKPNNSLPSPAITPATTLSVPINMQSKKSKRRAGKKKQEKRRRRQEQPSYELRDAGIKGFGLFALRKIEPGERIIEENPLLVVDIGDHMHEEIINGFMNLSPADQNSFMELCSHETGNKETRVEEAMRPDSPTLTVSKNHETDITNAEPPGGSVLVDVSAAGIQSCPLEDSENEYGGCTRPEAAIDTLDQSSDQNSESDTPAQSDTTPDSEPGSDTSPVDSPVRGDDSECARECDDMNETTIERIIEIWRTNSYALDDGFMLDTAAICLTAARLNHACIPNVHCAYNKMTNKLTVQATRPITADEELCTSYIQGAYMLRSERQQELLKWGFGCRCETCSKENESRRQELKTLSEEVKAAREIFPALSQTQLAHAAATLLRMVELMSEDGLLNPELADVCFGAAACCTGVGRIDDARSLQENRLEILLRCYGADSPVFLREEV